MIKNTVKDSAFNFGAEVCGIATIERFQNAPAGFHPTDILPDAKSVVVVGKQFSKSVFDAKTNAPYTLMRNKLIEIIDSISMNLSFEMEKSGFQAVPIPSSEPYEFWDESERHGKGILSLKHAAELAGVGRIGKNTLLINEKFGNRLWLGAVVCNVSLEPDEMVENLCMEQCRICLDACPKSALDSITISQKKCREICATYTYGGGFLLSCNICREVCPFSRV